MSDDLPIEPSALAPPVSFMLLHLEAKPQHATLRKSSPSLCPSRATASVPQSLLCTASF